MAPQEPDIEDLMANRDSIKHEQMDNVSGIKRTAHELNEHELQELQHLLVAWYDRCRRKLPWRGDPPPYVTTAMHTKEKKSTGKCNSMSSYLQLKKEPVGKSDNPTAVVQHSQEFRKVTPYETWVSEIMLQQTRVDTVVNYFLKWINKFPTIEALANGSEEEVNALWAGLGYYRRARMLHEGAKYVVKNFNGELPATTEKLTSIPGIGPYTAGAISSIAFGHQEPLVDGNVIRVVARLCAIGADPKNKHLIQFAWKVARDLVQHSTRPGALNQALMELGATTCTVQNPSCESCPARLHCLAYEESQSKERHGCGKLISSDCLLCDRTRADEWNNSCVEVTKYPLKAKKSDSKNEAICVAVISRNQDASLEFLMSKRPEDGLLAGQWEFIHVKVNNNDTIPPYAKRQKVINAKMIELFGSNLLATNRKNTTRSDVGTLTHIFSHVKHHMGIEHIHLLQPDDGELTSDFNLRWMTHDDMIQAGITTGVKKILQLVQDPCNMGKRSKKAMTAITKGCASTKRLKTIASFFTK